MKNEKWKVVNEMIRLHWSRGKVDWIGFRSSLVVSRRSWVWWIWIYLGCWKINMRTRVLFDVERSSLDTYVELVPGKCWNVCEGSCRIEKGILRGALRSWWLVVFCQKFCYSWRRLSLHPRDGQTARSSEAVVSVDQASRVSARGIGIGG